jgi:hypothetical protein
MRTVRINGQNHNIPKDREWILRDRQINNSENFYVTTEYCFRAEPYDYVDIRTNHEKIGFQHGDEVADVEVWDECPREPLNNYLLVDDGRNPYASLDFQAPKVGFGENYEEYEKRFLNALDKPMANPCAEQRPGRKSAEIKMRGPAVKLDSGSFGLRYLPRFEEEYKFMETEEALAPEETNNMSDPKTQLYAAGTRVLFTNTRTEEIESGTLVGRTPDMRGKTQPSEVLVATDKASKYNNKGVKYTGKNHGIYIDTLNEKLTEMNPSKWNLVPPHIGVVSRQGFVQDDVKISKGRTGRIVNRSPGNDDMIGVSWNFSNPNFSSEVDKSGVGRHNIWSVPAAKINLCLINGPDGNIKTVWPNKFGSGITYEVGDLCKIAGRGVTVLDNRDREVTLSVDTIVELLERGDVRNRNWNCRVIGGCPDSIFNHHVNIRENYLRQHPTPDLFYRPGQGIEIVAEVDFRKRPLQGMKGKVILSTDAEGDVGIEFKEDIGAGSLDGIGKEGHCIYIEASLVKSSG